MNSIISGSDPLLRYELHKFSLLLVPDFLLKNLHTFVGAIIISLVPYTPINFIIFCIVFLFVYWSNILNLSSYTVNYCRYNQPDVNYRKSILSALRNSYLIYLFIAILINYNSIFIYQSEAANIIVDYRS